jgi:hypothetical protein
MEIYNTKALLASDRKKNYEIIKGIVSRGGVSTEAFGV